jgi:uncharacterized repeat protein (TIGR01451 family)
MERNATTWLIGPCRFLRDRLLPLAAVAVILAAALAIFGAQTAMAQSSPNPLAEPASGDPAPASEPEPQAGIANAELVHEGCTSTLFTDFSVYGVNGVPVISADSSHVAFWSTEETPDNHDGNIEIFVVAGTTPPLAYTQVTSSTGSILGGFNLDPAINAVGTVVAFFSDRDLVAGQNTDANFEILLYDSASGLVQVTHTRGGVNVSPSIQADAKSAADSRVAFASDRDLVAGQNPDGNLEIFLYQSGGFTQITKTSVGSSDQPSISADGKRIAFVSTADLTKTGSNSDGSQEIFLYDSTKATNRFTQITADTRCASDQPAISGDGTRVVFRSDCTTGHVRQIFFYDGASSRITQVTTIPDGSNEEPAINTDGSLIAFVSDQDLAGDPGNSDGNPEIFLYEPEQQTLFQLTDTPDGTNSHPSVAGVDLQFAFNHNRDIYRASCTPAALRLTKDGPTSVVAGTQLTYVLTVTNDGPLSAAGLKLVDTLPAGVTFLSASHGCTESGGIVTCNLATLPPPLSTTITITVRVDPATRGTLNNEATATASLAAPDTDTAVTEVIAQADLSLTKTAPVTATAGTALTYTLTVRNDGPSQATGVRLTDTLPTGVTFRSVSPATCAGSPGSRDVTCDLGSLDVGETKAVTIGVDVKPETRGSIRNTATVTATEHDPTHPNDASASTRVVARVDLVLTKSDTPDPVVAGTALTYTLTVTNDGPSQATNVILNDTLPGGVEFITATAACDAANDLVTCPLGSLAPLQTNVVTIAVSVRPSTRGTITNTAQVTSAQGEEDTNPSNNTDIEVTTAITTQVDLVLSKTAPATVIAGDLVTYTLTVTNDGPSLATGVRLSDTLPLSVTFSSASTGCHGGRGNRATCTLPDLAPEMSATVLITARVDPTANGWITNTASASSIEADRDQGNNLNVEASSSVVRIADLSVTKAGFPGTVVAGTTLTYTLVYTNAGPSTARQVALTDTLPPGVTYGGVVTWTNGLSEPLTIAPALLWLAPELPVGPPALADRPGAGTPFTGTIVLTVTVAADLADGPISNTVTISSATADPRPATNAYTETTTVSTEADLAVAKAVGPQPAESGGTLTYTLVYTNYGRSVAHSVLISDVLPADIRFEGVLATDPSLPVFTKAGQLLTWSTPTLAVRATGTITFTASVTDHVTSPLTNTVVITSRSYDPGPWPNRDVVTTTLDADLGITKASFPAQAVPGTVLTYTIVVTNAGPSEVISATVSDDLPDAKFENGDLFWKCAASAGSSCRGGSGGALTDVVVLERDGILTYTITGTLLSSITGTLVNTATVSAPVWIAERSLANNRAADSNVLIPEAGLRAQKTVDNAWPVEGETITYTITAFNAGPSDVSKVQVRDSLPGDVQLIHPNPNHPGEWKLGGYTWEYDLVDTWTLKKPGRLRPDQSAILWLKVQVKSGTVGKTITNTALVTSSQPHWTDPYLADNTDSAIVTVRAAADLAITKTVSGPSAGPAPSVEAVPGDAITYTLRFINHGPNPAIGVTITDVIPISITALHVISSGAAITDTGASLAYVWQVQDLAPGAGGVITISGVLGDLIPAGTFSNTAFITSTVVDPYPGDNQSQAGMTVLARADLAITKTVAGPWGGPASSVEAVPGDPITYTLQFVNRGPHPAIGVTITDAIPISITVQHVISSGVAITDTGGSPAYVWQVQDLAPGAGGAITISGVLGDLVAAGTFSNTAFITSTIGDPNPGDDHSQAGVTVLARADLVITKTVTGPWGGPGSSVQVAPGQPITYTLRFINRGPHPATGVVITDIIPVSVTQVLYDFDGLNTDPQDRVWFPLYSPVPVGEGGVITITGVLSDALAVGTFTNTAVISSVVVDPIPGDNYSQAAVIVPPAPSLTVTKTLIDPPGGVATASDPVTFTIRLTNTGQTTISTLVLTDTYDAACMTLTSADPPTGTQGSGQATWALTDVGLGIAANKAITVQFSADVSSTACTNAIAVAGADELGQPLAPEHSSASVQISPALSIGKVVTPTTVALHREVTYTVVLANHGVADAVGVWLTDTLPSEVSYVRPIPPPNGASINGSPETLTWTGTVTAGQAITYTFVVSVTTGGGTITNTAEYSHTSSQGEGSVTFTIP